MKIRTIYRCTVIPVIIGGLLAGMPGTMIANELPHIESTSITATFPVSAEYHAALVMPEPPFLVTPYIFRDGRILTEMPAKPIPDSSLRGSGSENEASDVTSATVNTQFTVLPTRILVINEDSLITEVWNSVLAEDEGYYLKIKLFSCHGQEAALSEPVLDQYNDFLRELDWSVPGKIY